MKEAYVSYKISKLLKEKGFNWDTYHYYDEIGRIWFEDVLCDWNYRTTPEVSCPTQQMAMCWLREEKMIFISPFPTFKSSPTFKSRLPYSWRVDIKNCFGEELGGNYEYITYEDAVESALEYVLTNLI